MELQDFLEFLWDYVLKLGAILGYVSVAMCFGILMLLIERA